MGQGCNSGCSNDFQSKTPDSRIEYTGVPAPSLGVCIHDTLKEVLTVTLQKLVDYGTGVGISLPDIDLTTCDAFADCIDCCGSCTDLPCLLNCYKNAICSIFNDVAELREDVDALLNGPYDTGCLDNVTSASPLNAIIQEMILELCALETSLGVLQGTVSGFMSGIGTTVGNFLNTAITSCQGTTVLNKTGSGASINFSLKGFVPIGTIMMAGSNLNLADFDGTGLGRSGTGACGWALCNGNNGTDNMSGLFPVGTGMGPAVITGMVFPFNTTGGQYGVTLTGAQSGIPAHTHTVTDPGHSHVISFGGDQAGSGGSNVMKFDSTGLSSTLDGTPDIGSIKVKVRTNTTGITIGTTTAIPASTSHTNVPPYRALYFIQRVS